MAQVLKSDYFANELLHGPFDIPITWTVDKGVQHGGDHQRVHHQGHHIVPWRK